LLEFLSCQTQEPRQFSKPFFQCHSWCHDSDTRCITTWLFCQVTRAVLPVSLWVEDMASLSMVPLLSYLVTKSQLLPFPIGCALGSLAYFPELQALFSLPLWDRPVSFRPAPERSLFQLWFSTVMKAFSCCYGTLQTFVLSKWHRPWEIGKAGLFLGTVNGADKATCRCLHLQTWARFEHHFQNPDIGRPGGKKMALGYCVFCSSLFQINRYLEARKQENSTISFPRLLSE
jgi:hypothetical protein